MATGLIKELTGSVTYEDRYELSKNDDILTISSATVKLLRPAGDIFTGAGNDSVYVVDSTITTEDGVRMQLGSGDDRFEIQNSTLSGEFTLDSGDDIVVIKGEAQSKVVLNRFSDADTTATMSFGDGNDVLELGSLLTGSGNLDFGTGSDTLRFNGGTLSTTGTIANLSNLDVTAAGGTLGRSLSLSGDTCLLALNGSLTGTANNFNITVAGKVSLVTADNIKTNLGIVVSDGGSFTHAAGGTLEIKGNTNTAFTANSATVFLHDLVATDNRYGLTGSATAWTVKDSNFSNNTTGISLTGGTLDLTSVGFANNTFGGIRLSGTVLTGEDVTFSKNHGYGYGGAIQGDQDITLNKAAFNGNYATAYASYSYYGTAYASACGAIGMTGGTLNLANTTFSGNYASAYATATASRSSNATAYASACGAIGMIGGTLNLANTTFSGNYAYAYATASANGWSSAYATATACGAIGMKGGTLNSTNATFTGNSAYDYNGAGGAIYGSGVIANLRDNTFANNKATYGGAIGLVAKSKMTYTLSSGSKIANTGNQGTSGGFLYLEASDAEFATETKAVLTIGQATASASGDSIYGNSGSTITKSGDGSMVVHSDVTGYSGNWSITGGVLELATRGRSIDLGKYTIGAGAMLKLSALNDTVTMTTDKKIGILDLGGGSDTLNTAGYTLSNGEIRVSQLTLSGGGIVKSAITTRDADAGFDLILNKVTVESDITGGNAVDKITVTEASTLAGAISLGGGDDILALQSTTEFSGALNLGAGNDTITATSVDFGNTVDFGAGNDTITATSVIFRNTVDFGAGDDSITAQQASFQDVVSMGDGVNKITVVSGAVFAQGVAGGSGNDSITLKGPTATNTISGVVALGGGENIVTLEGTMDEEVRFNLASDGSTRYILYKGSTQVGNSVSVGTSADSALTAVKLDWSGIENLDKVRIAVSSDPLFNTFEFAVEIYNGLKNFTINVEDGYFLQFQANNEDGWSQWLLPDEVAPNKVLGVTAKTNGSSQEISWVNTYDNLGGNGVEKYEIQVATGKQFRSPVITADCDVNQYVANLGVGNYYIRVRAIDYTGNIGEWSDIASMTVGVPDIIPPGMVGNVTVSGSVITWNAAADNQGGSGVGKYRLEISRTADFAATVVASDVTTLSYTAQLDDGSYYVRIKAVDNAGNEGLWSDGTAFWVGSAPEGETILFTLQNKTSSYVAVKTLAAEVTETAKSFNATVAGSTADYLILGNDGAGTLNVAGNSTSTVYDSTIASLYVGNLDGNGKVGGDVVTAVTDSRIGDLYAATSTSVAGAVKLTISGTSVITNEIQGGTVSGNTANNSCGSSLITLAGGTLGGVNERFFVHTGNRVTGNGSVAVDNHLTGSATLELLGGTVAGGSYLFVGGFAFGGKKLKGSQLLTTTVDNGTVLTVNGTKFDGRVSVYGGGRAATTIGKSVVENGSRITISTLTTTARSIVNFFGGAHNDGVAAIVNGGSLIQVSGSSTIGASSKVNLYGGGNGGSQSIHAIVNGGSEIRIGEVGAKTNITLNNVYGGGSGDSKVNGGSRIVFAGNGKVNVTGVLCGDGVTDGTVQGEKVLEFSNFNSSSTLSVAALKNFDSVIVDSFSLVEIGSRSLDLSTVGNFTFQLDDLPVAEEDVLLTFGSGVKAWQSDVNFSVNLEGTLVGDWRSTLLQADDSLDDLAGASVDWTLYGIESDTVLNCKIGENVVYNGVTLALELVDLDANGLADALQLVMLDNASLVEFNDFSNKYSNSTLLA